MKARGAIQRTAHESAFDQRAGLSHQTGGDKSRPFTAAKSTFRLDKRANLISYNYRLDVRICSAIP